jgi:peptidoglycan/xylan/chitin deacetylase (PgdA/CDA1 family)
VRPETFDKQMAFLQRRRYKTVSMEFVRSMTRSGKIDPKSFAITFDDGYKNNAANAAPVLRKYGFKGTVYVVADAIGKLKEYPYMPAAEHMSLEDLKSVGDVLEVGSHTNSHPDLSVLVSTALVREVVGSKKTLEKQLGKPVTAFCYPFGMRFTGYETMLSSAGYTTATTTENGFVSHGADVYALPRVEWKEWKAMNARDFFRNLDFYLKVGLGM